MEKAKLNDLSNFSKNEKFFLINTPFKEIYGDNILRFLSKQIIEAPETREDVFRYPEVVDNGFHLSKVRSYKMHK